MTTDNNNPNDQPRAPQGISISVKIDRIIDKPGSHVKAIASVYLGGAFAVHDIMVMEGQKGLFVKMPFKSFTRNGQTTYDDVFHPISADARNQLNAKIVDTFWQKFAANGGAPDPDRGYAGPGMGSSYPNGRNAYSYGQRGFPVLVEPDADNPFV